MSYSAIGTATGMTQQDVDDCLRGAVDVHTHGGSEPRSTERMMDEFDMAIEYTQAGFEAVVVKTHHTPSASRNILVQKFIDRWAKEHDMKPTQVVGGVTLNYTVGGLNPAAVRVVAEFPNGKFVWLPCMDSYEHAQIVKGGVGAFCREPKPEGIKLLDDKGEIVPELEEILGIVADNDMVLSTGHYTAPTKMVVIEEAKRAGVKRIVNDHINLHPKYRIHPTAMTIEEMKEAAKAGSMLGISVIWYCNPYIPQPQVFTRQIIKEVGAEHLVLGSDLGEPYTIHYVEGIKWLVRTLLWRGISKTDVERILKHNGAKLLGLST
jgi:hypothetical protein